MRQRIRLRDLESPEVEVGTPREQTSIDGRPLARRLPERYPRIGPPPQLSPEISPDVSAPAKPDRVPRPNAAGPAAQRRRQIPGTLPGSVASRPAVRRHVMTGAGPVIHSRARAQMLRCRADCERGDERSEE